MFKLVLTMKTRLSNSGASVRQTVYEVVSQTLMSVLLIMFCPGTFYFGNTVWVMCSVFHFDIPFVPLLLPPLKSSVLDTLLGLNLW